MPGGVNRPFDGIFTGIVGVDSTEFFTFDLTAAVGEPGIYSLTAFTDLEGDENRANDAFTGTIIRRPVINTLPYVQGFENGNGFWFPQRAGNGPVSWELGRPTTERLFGAGDGDNAYVTNLNGPYGNNELSYLTSPCFDFSGLSQAPFLSFLLSVDTEENFDGFYLQASTDGGRTYARVPANATSTNWYNNRSAQQWDGDGGFGEGYALVGQQLQGLAGRADVRLRFVFRSDGDGQREGIAIDNIRLTERQAIDFAAVDADFRNFRGCGDRPDTLVFTFTDLGQERSDSVTVGYRIAGDTTITQRVAAPSIFGNRQQAEFLTNLVPATADAMLIEAFVIDARDLATFNDTLRFVFRPVATVPFAVDFEEGRRPRNWAFDEDLIIAQLPGLPSRALTDNLTSQDSVLEFTTTRYGPFTAEDELSFTVRQVDANGQAISDGIGSLTVTARPNCTGDSIVLLSSTEDISRDFSILLGELAGQTATLTFRITHGAGDFFAAVDDIRVRRCSGIELALTTIPPSGTFADDGEAYLDVRGGLAPYTYAWSTGDSTQSVDSLSVQDYSVTVTDAVGCTATRTVSVTLTATGTKSVGPLAGLEVFPNPTTGRVAVRVELPEVRELSVAVFDVRGQRIGEQFLGRAQQLSAEVDLSDHPTGLYLLRVRAGESVRTVRVMRD